MSIIGGNTSSTHSVLICDSCPWICTSSHLDAAPPPTPTFTYNTRLIYLDLKAFEQQENLENATQFQQNCNMMLHNVLSIRPVGF